MNVNDNSIRSDLAKLDALRDEDIDYSDIPALDESFFARATLAWPAQKKRVTLRLDADVLDWLRSQGKGYQTRVNAVLRAYMQFAEKRR